MRFFKFAVVSFWLLTASLAAQTNGHPDGWGQVFGAIGGTSDGAGFFHFGGGGGGLVAGGLGVNVDLGAANSTGGGSFIGIFSPGALYAFNRDKRWSPFVAGGYSLAFRRAVAHGGYFGGGVNYFLSERFGLRFEVRDHVFSGGGALHLVEGRVSLLFL